MAYLFEVAKLILKDEIKNRLNKKINKIQDSGDWSKFEIGVPLDNVDTEKSSYEELLHEKNVWEELAKLSIDLWNDYEHYRRFYFKSRYDSKMYFERLTSLGFVRDGRFWKSMNRPAIEEVQINVFMLCFCQQLVGSDDELNRRNDENERRKRDKELGCVKTGVLEKHVVDQNITDVGIRCQFCECCNDSGAISCSICNSDLTNCSKEVDNDYSDVDELVTIWRCASCTFKNKLENKRCEVCDSSRKTNVQSLGACSEGIEDAEMWQCPSCTFNNKLESRCCEVCYTIRETELQEEDVDTEGVVYVTQEVTETWNCQHCQHDNLLNTYLCAQCNKFAPFFHRWRCERCSFFNTELCPLCTVCGHKNGHLRKCDKCRINVVHIDNSRTCAPCSVLSDDIGSTSQCEGEKKENKDSKDRRKTSSDQNVLDDDSKVAVKRKCAMCKNRLKTVDDGLCRTCEASRYYCNNRWCGAINNVGNNHCSKCGLKKGSNVTEYNMVEAHDGSSFVQMWQCTFCGLFNCHSKCAKCENHRHGPTHKKCACNWVNPLTAKRCDKCSIKLM